MRKLWALLTLVSEIATHRLINVSGVIVHPANTPTSIIYP
ncbi:hypothetical protein SX4_3715 [Vibrio mimicus SX-4]|nr:hypothetical protein SX4_3715 [Vibrio mimicus SX-4]